MQPPASAYLRQDDFLQVNVLTSATTDGLVLRGRLMRPDGTVEDIVESLDGAEENTLTTSVFPLSEGFLLSAVASNLGGGMADSVCFVNIGLQRNAHTGTAPHTILCEGFVTNIYSVEWPPAMPRGPAPGGAPAAVLAWVERQPSYPAAAPNAMDDEFDGAALDTAKWTWLNQNAAVPTQAGSYLSIAAPSTNGLLFQALTQPLPAAPYEFTLELTPPTCAPNQAITGLGLGLYDSVSTTLYILWAVQNPPTYVYPQRVTGQAWIGTAFSAELTGGPWQPPYGDFYYVRIGNTGSGLTPLYLDVSSDGVHYTRLATIALGFAPDLVGIFFINDHPTGAVMLADCDFFRRTL